MSRNWLITGAGRGLGLAFTRAVLDAGDRVVATARQPDALRSELASYGSQAVVLPLDVNDRAAVFGTVDEAISALGHLDVVVNNAGYGLAGAVEEITEAQARAQFDTNFFGALWVTQAVLPHLRSRRSGHIVQISSIAGVMAAPNLGVYCASKWALEAMSEALAAEVQHLGIKVSIIEPSGFRTDWAGSSMERAAPIADYDEVLAARRTALNGESAGLQAGDPDLAAQALLTLVGHPSPPLRLVLGNLAVDIAQATYRKRLDAQDPEWESVSRSTDVPVG
jgi:NAD(P)-dependent dehydrogenase (short-subunit alcohol dehydrogenase family)